MRVGDVHTVSTPRVKARVVSEVGPGAVVVEFLGDPGTHYRLRSFNKGWLIITRLDA